MNLVIKKYFGNHLVNIIKLIRWGGILNLKSIYKITNKVDNNSIFQVIIIIEP
jgi:hypothetical protein